MDNAHRDLPLPDLPKMLDAAVQWGGYNRGFIERLLQAAGVPELLVAYQQARDERDDARQALWNVYGALGFDQDGAETPASVVGLEAMVVRSAAAYRAEVEKDYDSDTDALREQVAAQEVRELERSLADLTKDRYALFGERAAAEITVDALEQVLQQRTVECERWEREYGSKVGELTAALQQRTDDLDIANGRGDAWRMQVAEDTLRLERHRALVADLRTLTDQWMHGQDPSASVASTARRAGKASAARELRGVLDKHAPTEPQGDSFAEGWAKRGLNLTEHAPPEEGPPPKVKALVDALQAIADQQKSEHALTEPRCPDCLAGSCVLHNRPERAVVDDGNTP